MYLYFVKNAVLLPSCLLDLEFVEASRRVDSARADLASSGPTTSRPTAFKLFAFCSLSPLRLANERLVTSPCQAWPAYPDVASSQMAMWRKGYVEHGPVRDRRPATEPHEPFPGSKWSSSVTNSPARTRVQA
ncbi:hypothetical protein PDE_00037 [Penicillium oxalicum 114-2]|uniref:Uncharacterized protein n=1 Tax=Penicillium oxalicum (strain 114-2 / CGMCC 5302) TaxID=933388 RepID=S7Z8V7_PENO1|nr:hypothetical protein PDE_00037 [Penicillium oxalicum 114-2]